jgi:hypothetical protein
MKLVLVGLYLELVPNTFCIYLSCCRLYIVTLVPQSMLSIALNEHESFVSSASMLSYESVKAAMWLSPICTFIIEHWLLTVNRTNLWSDILI